MMQLPLPSKCGYCIFSLEMLGTMFQMQATYYSSNLGNFVYFNLGVFKSE